MRQRVRVSRPLFLAPRRSGTWSCRSGRLDLARCARLAALAEPGQRRERPPRNIRLSRPRISVKIAISRPARPANGSLKLASTTS
jgi:hypothetical protein